MPSPSIAIRLGTDGGSDVKNTFDQIGAAGDATAARLQAAFERQSAAAERANERVAQAARKLAATQIANDPALAARNIATGASVSTADQARQLAASRAAFAAYADQQATLEKRAESLRSALDPLYTAQKRYDAEIANAAELLAAGKISQELHTAQVIASERALRDAKAALEGHSNALGLNRMQAITAQSAVLRFVDAVVSGRSPITAFALEAHKGAEVLSLDEGGMAGGLAKVRGLLNPVVLGVVALTAAEALAVVEGIKYAENLDNLSRAADGYGRASQLTGSQLLATAQQAAAAGHVTVSAAMATEEAILHATRTDEDALGRAVAISQRLADAMGVDLAGANKQLAAAMADPAKAADDLAAHFGLLDGKQVQNIHDLMEQNRLTDAQTGLLADLDKALDKTGEHVNALSQDWRNLKSWASGAMEAMGAAMADQYARETGQQNNQQKIADLRALMVSDQNNLKHFVFDRSGIEAEIAGYQAQINRLQAQDNAAAQSAAAGARRNQLAQEVLQVERASGATNKYSEVLEHHRQVIAMLKQAQAMGIAVDPQVLNAKEHQLRGEELIGGEGNREAAIQAARARMRNAAPHSKARQQAASDLESIMTAGRDMTDDQAAAAAKERGLAALGHVKEATDRHAEALKREAEAMEVNTAESLKLAEGYLQMGTSELVLEARRKAMTDATKKGADVEAQVRRQVALAVAEEAVTQAKAVGHLREENATRADLNDRLEAGTLTAADYNKALQDEDALRPLLKLKLVAHGEALRIVTELIEAQTDALREQHDQEARNAALMGGDAALRNAQDTIALMKFAGDPQQRALEAARLAAQHEADDKGMTGADRDFFLSSKAQEARANLDNQRADFMAQTVRSQQDSLALTQRETQLVGANDNVRQAELDKLQMILQLKKQGIDPESEDGQAILANVAALDKEAAKLRQLAANFDELKSFGDQFLGDVLNPDNWKTFGDFGMMVLHDLETELIKLAALNPLKNWVLGENNPTAGGIFGMLGKLLGGGGGSFGSLFGGADFGTLGAGVGDLGSLLPDIALPAFAGGTDYAPGGFALVGEEGAELLNLPRGTKVTPAAQTRQLLSANDSGIGTLSMPISIYAPGADPAALARLTSEVRDLKRSLPGTIITTMIDARQRRVA